MPSTSTSKETGIDWRSLTAFHSPSASKRYPLKRYVLPVSLSLGKAVWQYPQSLPTWRAKDGNASAADGSRTAIASSMSVFKKNTLCGIPGLRIFSPWLRSVGKLHCAHFTGRAEPYGQRERHEMLPLRGPFIVSGHGNGNGVALSYAHIKLFCGFEPEL